jgi:flavorubredoxin
VPKPFEAVKIAERVYWVGAVDWGIREFHGYSTTRGTTYNAYLVLAETPTLIDTVKAPFRNELMSRIASVMDPRDIHTIVSNHSEMDHTGSLPGVVDAVAPDRIVASSMGVKTLAKHFPGLQVSEVKDGETLSLGDTSLTFYETRMLHWPDSMISHLADEEVLFSQDAFGMHLASSERFDDELDPAVLDQEAAKYYANILMPFSPLVTKLLARVGELALPTRLVAPDHGPVWRRDIGGIMGSYAAWAAQKPTRKAVVAYDTMWQSTALMARAIGDGLAAGGASVHIAAMRSSERSDVATEILDAGALVVGSPTMNGNLFPTVADLLVYIKGLKPRNLIGAAFGSYGWSGESVTQVADALSEAGVDLAEESLKVQYVPDDEALSRCRVLGERLAARLASVTRQAG